MKIKNSKIRDDLILKHKYIVYQIVQKFQKKISSIWDIEDLISIGTIGLINAVDNYKIDMGTKLSTYARRKIYGAILDYFRSEDHLSRSNRNKLRKTEEAIKYLEHELCREVCMSEVAEKLHKSLEEYYDHILDIQQMQLQSIEESYENEHTSDINLEQDSFFIPDNLLTSKEFITKLSNIIMSLPEKERLIFCLYFYEELSMRQIGVILQLGESRISQLLQKIMKSIKEVIYA